MKRWRFFRFAVPGLVTIEWSEAGFRCVFDIEPRKLLHGALAILAILSLVRFEALLEESLTTFAAAPNLLRLWPVGVVMAVILVNWVHSKLSE